MNQDDNTNGATVVDTEVGDEATAETPSDTTTETIVADEALRDQQLQDGLAIRAASSAPIDGQVTLRAEICRLEQARALREVLPEQYSGMPYFEPGSIERFADTDGRTMAIVVSFGELVKLAVED